MRWTGWSVYSYLNRVLCIINVFPFLVLCQRQNRWAPRSGHIVCSAVYVPVPVCVRFSHLVSLSGWFMSTDLSISALKTKQNTSSMFTVEMLAFTHQMEEKRQKNQQHLLAKQCDAVMSCDFAAYFLSLSFHSVEPPLKMTIVSHCVSFLMQTNRFFSVSLWRLRGERESESVRAREMSTNETMHLPLNIEHFHVNSHKNTKTHTQYDCSIHFTWFLERVWGENKWIFKRNIKMIKHNAWRRTIVRGRTQFRFWMNWWKNFAGLQLIDKILSKCHCYFSNSVLYLRVRICSFWRSMNVFNARICEDL